MTRTDIMLAAMSVDEGALYGPVQVQKMFFLIDQNVSQYVGGSFFNFAPHAYGPFDIEVYRELENLIQQDLVGVVQKGNWKEYSMPIRLIDKRV